MKEFPLGAMKATKMKEKESTITATEAVMKFAFGDPRPSLCTPLSILFPISSNASEKTVSKQQIVEAR